MNLTCTFDPADLARIKKKLDGVDPAQRGRFIKQGLQIGALVIENELRNVATAGDTLKRRTGNLSRSIGTAVVESSNGMEAVIGSGVRSGKRLPYANIHEIGGTILPKKGRFLRIPIRKGSDFALERGMGKKRISFSSGVLGYIFVKSVKIPARYYLSKSLDKKRTQALNKIEESIDKGLRS
jgi:phage gpG-like protein